MNSRIANTSGTRGTVLLLAGMVLSGCISNGEDTRDLAIVEPPGLQAAKSDSTTLDSTTPVNLARDRAQVRYGDCNRLIY